MSPKDEIRIGGIAVRYLVEGHEANNTVAMFEFDVAPGSKVPGPHSHDGYEETAYGLGGILTFTVEGKVREVGPGQVVVIPRGAVHRFDNFHSTTATLLTVITPGILGPSYVWEDVVEQVPLPGQGPGLDSLKDILRAMRSGFPDLVFSIQEQVAAHDKVASRFEWTGTHDGEFLGIPATGRPVRVWGVVIDRLEDGRIKDTRIIMDTFGMMVQLGVLPSPPSP